jgi:lipopolysaccharide/colanic/teichoic acid biosynthesis glycosyltransferase
MKRIIDLFTAILLLLLLALPLLLLICLVYCKLGKPILFRQLRPGLYGQSFEMIKFRTMTDARDNSGALLPDSQRLTRFGLFLRSSSLDELPELWNVLKGEMSLVGPRPLLMEYLPFYSAEQARRHDVRPGITGWAQINGRNNISWTKKIEMDIWYVNNKSVMLDLKILFLTIGKVLKKDGVSKDGHTTTDFFNGKN